MREKIVDVVSLWLQDECLLCGVIECDVCFGL